MFFHTGKPKIDPGICFICELAPTRGYVDTLKDFDPAFFHFLNGRKFVCRECIDTMAKLLDYAEAAPLKAEISRLQEELEKAVSIKDHVIKLESALQYMKPAATPAPKEADNDD